MTNRKLKKMIREAFAHGTPDISQEIMVDTLFSDPQDRKEVVTSVEEQRKPIRFPIFSIAAAACAAIAVLAISINLITNRPNSGSAALITADQAMDAVYAYPFNMPTAAVAPQVDCQLDEDASTPHYDVTLNYGEDTVFEFIVDAKTGTVISAEQTKFPNTVDLLSEADAKAIALVSVQLTESQITAYSSDFEYDSQNPHYDIVFVANDIKYDFEIHAITGNVLNVATESVKITIPTPSIIVITPVSVALDHAGLTLEEVANLETHEDLDDDIPHIDVSFIANGLKYEYEVKAGGTILDYETEPMEDDFISSSEAMAKFWEYLNVTPAPLSNNLSWTLINYQDRMCYDIIGENTDGSGVRMKIDATTGALLLKESADGLQPIPTPNVPDGKLSTDQATSIALKQVGLSSKRLVTDFELEEDSDDDHPHYDVSFVYQGVEYSFEIGMYDGGQILEAEQDPVD